MSGALIWYSFSCPITTSQRKLPFQGFRAIRIAKMWNTMGKSSENCAKKLRWKVSIDFLTKATFKQKLTLDSCEIDEICTLSIWPSIKAKDISRSFLFSPDVRIDMAGPEFWKNQDLICPNEATLMGFDPRGAKGHLWIKPFHFSCYFASSNHRFKS